jgi:hypothetical protein
MYIIHQNIWCITRGTQPKKRMLHLESRYYNKLDPCSKAPASPILDERKYISALIMHQAIWLIKF